MDLNKKLSMRGIELIRLPELQNKTEEIHTDFVYFFLKVECNLISNVDLEGRRLKIGS